MKPKPKKTRNARTKRSQRAGAIGKRRAPARKKTAPVQSRKKKAVRQIGRRSTLTPEISARIAALVADGMRPTPAAATLGVSKQTLSSWRKDAPGFEVALEKADARYLQKLLSASDRIVASEDNLSAAGSQLRFLMERRFPTEYGPKTPDVHVNTNINAPLVLSAAQLEAIQAKRREGMRR